MTIGDIIVIAVILVLVAIAVRSLYNLKKKGGCCGECSSCGCGCSTCITDDTTTPHK